MVVLNWTRHGLLRFHIEQQNVHFLSLHLTYQSVLGKLQFLHIRQGGNSRTQGRQSCKYRHDLYFVLVVDTVLLTVSGEKKKLLVKTAYKLINTTCLYLSIHALSIYYNCKNALSAYNSLSDSVVRVRAINCKELLLFGLSLTTTLGIQQ